MAISRSSSQAALWRVLSPILVILGLVIGVLCWIKTEYSTDAIAETHAEIEVDKTLPDLTLTRVDGKQLRLSDIHAKVLMITFWATWCDSCMVEMPSIVSLRNKYNPQGFEVLAVNLDEKPETAANRVSKHYGIQFPIFKDPDGTIANTFDIHAIPLTLIINQQRKILLVMNGERDWDSPTVHSQLERWLSG